MEWNQIVDLLVRWFRDILDVIIRWPLAILLSLIGYFSAGLVFDETQSRLIGAVVFLVAMWTNEALPLGVVSLFPIILFPALDILTTNATTVNYSKSIIFLFLGGFMIAIAVEKICYDRDVSLRLFDCFILHRHRYRAAYCRRRRCRTGHRFRRPNAGQRYHLRNFLSHRRCVSGGRLYRSRRQQGHGRTHFAKINENARPARDDPHHSLRQHGNGHEL